MPQKEQIQTPTKTGSKRSPTALGFSEHAVSEISETLRHLLADVFSLYMKTKSFHWHMTGRHFRDYHLLLDEQAAQIYAITDDIAERARKLGGTSLRSIGDVARHQRLRDNDRGDLTAREMLTELREDNSLLANLLRDAHEVCEKHDDVATTSMIEVWIDQAERRAWFLREIVEQS
ncbi:Dps family protein [Paludibaculum fermentans]|uniref:DNA starvation/stationary phase protection protein n=1 Tax=Paludibaculum fermentans TaxID=1473598 RepID=A0A7S7NQA5_PALFE|nr:DNA starvation/stationary phase protection protein [Paludibaculum fermentans]QOY87765.1 DNA starvation/stationary phase protection protein [Paludibaculum fermentans]